MSTQPTEKCECVEPDDRYCPVHGDFDADDADCLGPVDLCNYCPHENADHRGDGCLYCGCVAAQ